MENRLRWDRKYLSPMVMAMILAACSQANIPGQKATVSPKSTASSTVAPNNAASTNSTKITQISPTSTTPAIASFETQPRMTGFSSNSQYFMHLESWRDTGAGVPHAALQVVNLPANTCVPKGCLRTRFGESYANQSISVAETNLLQQTEQLRQDLKLTAPVAGVTLPVLERSQETDGTEEITVRLQNNQPLRLTLRQKGVKSQMAGGTAANDQAAMQLDVAYAGKTHSLGSLDQMHDGMVAFSIREVQQSPDGKAIAILVTAAERAFEGTLGKTMVQGFAL